MLQTITLRNTSNVDFESDTTTNNDIYSTDESDDSNDTDSNKTAQGNFNSGRKGNHIVYVSLMHRFSL